VETQTHFREMSRRQLIVLLVLVVVIGGGAWLHSRKQAAAWSNPGSIVGRKLLGDFQVNDVAQIRVRHGAAAVDLVQSNGLWCVAQRGGYPADFSQISGLLLKLRDLKIIQTEEVGPSQWPRLNLAAGSGPDSATLLEFFDVGGKPLRALWLGKAHLHESTQPSGTPDMGDQGWPDGRYVLTATNTSTVAVVADPLTEVNTDPAQWLDKAFFKIEQPDAISVTYPSGTNSWALTKGTNGWELAGAKPGEKLDDTQAEATADALSSPTFNDVAVDARPAETGLDRPTRIGIKTADGFNYAIAVGAKTNDNYFLTVAVGATLTKTNSADKLGQESKLNQWTYLAPNWTMDPLLKTRSQFLVKPAVMETNAPATNAPPADTAATPVAR
jgi:hypothetical protein